MRNSSRSTASVGFVTAGILALLFNDNPLQQYAEHTCRIYQEDEVTITETSGGPKYSAPLFTYEPILQLEQDPSDLESLLFRPGKFTRGPDGSYYMMDRGNHRIAIFDDNGLYVRSFGGQGAGPGTFLSPSFQALHGDVLHIYDFQLNRTTRMRLDGSLIDVLTRPYLARSARRYQLSGNRQLLLHRDDVFGDKNHWQKEVLTIVDAEFDTLVHVKTDSVLISVRGADPVSQGRSFWLVRFRGIPCSDYSPTRGIYLSNGQTPVINRYNNVGNLIGRIVLDLPPSPVTREERRSIIAELNRKVRERTGLERQIAKEVRDNLTIPDVKGWWQQMMIDEGGFIWLEVVGDDGTQPEVGDGSLCDIISPDGEYLGRTRLPTQFDGCMVIDGCICANLYDSETDEYRPTVFRIHSAVEGLKYPN